ncbi:hypothetical protein BDN72DRAFT_863847 [Pluteus cervinus]|uniref:Uncharacterized protein n=1 Tax=Pluteus cervinus TaxID=181527 RepID=A0ACD3A5F9_9AGAR|nr:hypothetical protein BDN72DRAFT_863847 [Pluteus cervinus]
MAKIHLQPDEENAFEATARLGGARNFEWKEFDKLRATRQVPRKAGMALIMKDGVRASIRHATLHQDSNLAAPKDCRRHRSYQCHNLMGIIHAKGHDSLVRPSQGDVPFGGAVSDDRGTKMHRVVKAVCEVEHMVKATCYAMGGVPKKKGYVQRRSIDAEIRPGGQQSRNGTNNSKGEGIGAGNCQKDFIYLSLLGSEWSLTHQGSRMGQGMKIKRNQLVADGSNDQALAPVHTEQKQPPRRPPKMESSKCKLKTFAVTTSDSEAKNEGVPLQLANDTAVPIYDRRKRMRGVPSQRYEWGVSALDRLGVLRGKRWAGWEAGWDFGL